jgi:hypothetical protein
MGSLVAVQPINLIKLDESEKNALLESYRTGTAITVICTTFNVSKSTLYGILDDRNEPKRAEAKIEIDWALG